MWPSNVNKPLLALIDRSVFWSCFLGNLASMSDELKTFSKEPWSQRSNEHQTVSTYPVNANQKHHHSATPLSCYHCNSIYDGDQCYSISKNNSNLNSTLKTKQCSIDQPYCKVRRQRQVMQRMEYNQFVLQQVYRVEYLVLEDFKAADGGTLDYTPWSMERNCSSECKNFCVTMGGRTKITYCTSCCIGNLCNTDNLASVTKQKSHYSILCSFLMLIVLKIYWKTKILY